MLQTIGIVSIALLTLSCTYGMGEHVKLLSKDQGVLAAKYLWISMGLQIFDFACGKASVIAFILEIQGPTHVKKRKALIAVGAFNASHSATPSLGLTDRN